jgi:hypothetical protein
MSTVKLIKDIYNYLDKSVLDIPENLYVPYTTIYVGQEGLTPLSIKDFKKVFTRWTNNKKQQGIDEFLSQEEDFTSDSDELSEVYKKYTCTTDHPLDFSKFVTAYTNYSKQFKL